MSMKNRMIIRYSLWLLDMGTIVASYMIATWLRYTGNNDWGNVFLHYMVGAILLLLCTGYTLLTDYNRDILTNSYLGELKVVLRFVVIVTLSALAAVFFLRWFDILSRFVMIAFTLCCTLLMYSIHVVYAVFIGKRLTSDRRAVRVLVLSDEIHMEETIARVRQMEQQGYRIVATGRVDDEGIADAMVTKALDEVFINAPHCDHDRIRHLIGRFEEMGVTCHYTLPLLYVDACDAVVSDFASYPVASYRRVREDYRRVVIKRAIDIAGGLVGCVLTALLAVVLVPAIRLESKGPAFFSQVRIGKNGRRFKIYKFRSMYVDAEERLAQMQSCNEMNGLMFKMDNDPRVTRIGKWLRKTSLDEFPQFFNVLKNDMSLIGTRPPTEAEFNRYNGHYRRRISMLPGLTGMWQVSGRSNITDFDEVVRLDLHYIDNWSLLLDFKILFRTVGTVLSGCGAR